MGLNSSSMNQAGLKARLYYAIVNVC